MIILILSAILWGCTSPQVTQGLITTNITADKKDVQIKIPSGSTVQEALKTGQVRLGEMDRVEPPLYAILADGDHIKVIRIREEYYIEQEVIPFEHQALRNEALTEGEERLSQPGVNGLQEVTYHRIFEDDIEVSTNIVKTSVLKPAIPEIMMIGSRSSFVSIEFPGKIAYLSSGNGWIIEKSSGNRKLVVTTGDLDGRIFTLSPDGKFLLFSRYSSEGNSINTLWVASLEKDPVKIIDLSIRNVVHFAEFNPNSSKVAYSTVEWRETAPGWQANNDLFEISVTVNGFVGLPKEILESNSGGVYGWWGMDFSWSPDAVNLLYTRPDSIGVVNSNDGSMTSIYSITPYQTGGNWAWVPGASWSPDGNVIYSVDHVTAAPNEMQGIQYFDLLAVPFMGGSPVHLSSDVGMFAYPVPSPIQLMENFDNSTSGLSQDQAAFLVAYLQAIFPNQSEISGYKLCTMDRDGSNHKVIFPEEGAVGLNPQDVVWSPEPMGSGDEPAIAFVYNGNIWMVYSNTGEALQITGDGLITQIDWR
jgi:hypothetical protein